jgi:hypothetical protein
MASKSQARDRGSSMARRPKLMRASATAPSLATGNASRMDLASLQNSRAATLLTRVASYSCAKESYERQHRKSVGSVCSNDGHDGRSPESASLERKEPFEFEISQCEYLEGR